MVGRNVLDGLRKGKKDIYALNVQYVRRYYLPIVRASTEIDGTTNDATPKHDGTCADNRVHADF